MDLQDPNQWQFLFIVLAGIGLYFLPTWFAVLKRGHVGAVFVINLFFGWTVLGWVGALAIAVW